MFGYEDDHTTDLVELSMDFVVSISKHLYSYSIFAMSILLITLYIEHNSLVEYVKAFQTNNITNNKNKGMVGWMK